MAQRIPGPVAMILAVVPYLVLQLDRGIRAMLRGFGGVPLLVALLLLAAAVPLALEGARQQPISQRVDDLRGGVSTLAGWVRMSGRIVTITSPESVAGGQQVQSLMIEPSGDAIVLISQRTLEQETTITGRLSTSANMGETARRIAGPRLPDEDLEIIDGYVLNVDDPLVGADERSWTFAWLAVLAAGVLLAGRAAGYPVVRLDRDRGPSPSAIPLEIGDEMDLRVVNPDEETGLRLKSPRGRLRRLVHREPTDPYFSLTIDGEARPILFRRHRWSRATPGVLWMVSERAPVVRLHDWGIEVLLVLDGVDERERLLASFAIDEGEAAAADG